MTYPARDPQYTNVADGDANVGVQVGVLHGNAYVYQTTPTPTPAEKFQVAKHYLRGGSPREAERRFTELVFEDRMSSAEIAYQWSLSVLSGRSLTSPWGRPAASRLPGIIKNRSESAVSISLPPTKSVLP